MTRVLVVDDHPIVRAGLAGLLDTEPDFEVVGEAASGEAALEMLSAVEAEVVLMDLRMPGIGGVEATRQIVQGEGSARVLVFTTYEGDDQILSAIEAGASGYLVKAAPAAELAAGVRAVAAGQTVLAPSIAMQLSRAARQGVRQQGAVAAGDADPAGGLPAGADAGGSAGAHGADGPRIPGGPSSIGGAVPEAATATALTPRELDILRLVAEGLSNPAIAARLYIGESTVKTHLLHAFEKLGVNDRTRAVIRAMELEVL